MHHLIGVNVIKCETELQKDENHLMLAKVPHGLLSGFDLFVQITPIGVLHDNQQHTPLFNGVLTSNNVWVVAPGQALHLIRHKATIFATHVIEIHHLGGEGAASRTFLNPSGTTKATLT